MGWADRAVHVHHDELQAVAIMKPVDPLPAEIGQRPPVLGLGQGFCLEPSHLRCRGRLRIDRPAAHDLARDWIKGKTVSIIDILIARQPPVDRLPEQPVEPVDGVLASVGFAQRRRREARQPERIIQVAHHQETTVRAEHLEIPAAREGRNPADLPAANPHAMGGPSNQSLAAINTMIYIENTMVTTAKSADFLVMRH